MLLVLLGVLVDAALLLLWLAGQPGPALLGVAGVAQAMIVVGGSGIAGLFAADIARDLLGR